MTSHLIEKALEVWLLQNLLNSTVFLGLFVLGLALAQQYYQSLQNYLTLRVSIELWHVITTVIIDILLALIVIVGYMVMNPDIMADIKIAVPFLPIATILFAIALVLRLFYHGHKLESANFMRSIWFIFAANIINIVGFTFVMEAPSGEYLAHHPSRFWTFIKTHLRSNADPHGLELAQLTFYICFPILLIVLIWGFAAAINQLKKKTAV